MAWVSPKVYAILKSSEEGKDILEGIAEKDQAEVDKEVDAFFGKGGKGEKDANAYTKAKMDDKAEEKDYQSMGDDKVKQGGRNVEEDNYTEDDLSIKEDPNKEGEFIIVDKEGNVVANGLNSKWEAKTELKDILANPEGKMSKGKMSEEDEEAEYEKNKKQFKDFIINHENYKPMVSAIKTQQGLMDKLNKQGFLNSADNKKWYETTKKIADLTHKIEKDYEDKIGMRQFMSASAITEYELMKEE